MLVAVVAAGVLALVTSVYGTVIAYSREIPHVIMQEFLDLPADFGPDLPLEGLRGLLVEGSPPNGCTPLAKPPATTNFTGKWIVLVSKDNCTFAQQVRNAQAAGFDCVIVHNVNSSELVVMEGIGVDDIGIPSVFVSDVAGLLLAKDYTYISGNYIMVDNDLPFNINTHLLLPFAIVVVLCLLVIVVFMIVKFIKDRRRAHRRRLPNRSLRKIPTCKFTKGDPYETCAICLDDYQEGEKLRVLPCAHAYHCACIDPWLTQNRRVCPVCKRRVFAAGERRAHSDSDSDDTEPLLPPARPTQGGTFDEQQENPFARATRFMARLRARTADVEAGNVSSENNDNTNEEDDANEDAADTRPLVAPPARTRRARRPRRAHSARHSINDASGEIGVAAIPVSPQPASPHHISL